MSDGGLFKAEVIYIRDCEKRGAGDMVQQETYTQLISPLDHTTPPQTPPPINAQAENTVHHFVSWPATMETDVNKHQGISQQQCHNTPVGAEVSSNLFLNRESDSDERLSPANSTDLFPDSSKSQSQESILSESWDKDRSWSALEMSPETSHAVSPCSSVRSGMFSPSVVRVKRHSLEPGSSLVHMPPTCFSPSCCESPSSSPCPLSPRSRHRPPPTRLSLLTAILRKGRLPVLSPTLTLQRPYSPCWPIRRGTSCNACSSASSVASIPLEVFSSRAQSSASLHSPSQSYRHKAGCVLESLRSVNAPPSIESKELSTSWRMVGPHSPPLRHSDEPKSNNGIISESVNPPSYRSHGSSTVPPMSQPFPQNLPKPVDYTKVPRPTLYSSHSRLRRLSPEPLYNSVNSRLNSLSPETKPVNNQWAPHDSNQHLYLSHSRLKCLSPSPASNQGTSACQPLYSSFSKLRSLSPGPVNTSSNSTLDSLSLGPVNTSSNSTLDSLSPGPVNTSSNSTLVSLSAEPKPVSKNFVQALNSHLRSKLSFLSSAPANNQETFKALVTSTPDVSSMETSNNGGTSMGTLNTWGAARPQVWSPLSYSSLSRLDIMSPKSSSLSCCAPEGHLSSPSQSPIGTVSSAQRHTDAISPTPLQNGLKTPSHSRQQLSVSPATRAFHLTPNRYTPPGCPSPNPPTPPSTPDRFTLSPSPAPPTHDLTPSPSLSLRSTPSPCLWREMSDSIDPKRKPHKIKLSYKTLAAIPTNTLLLDQQAIDDQVDQGDSQDPVTRRKKEDTHAEMCSPAQLRKQSEDLYAVIDHVLEDPVPIRQASPALAYPRETMDKYAPKRYTSLPRSLGRETKYATFNLQPSVERELTKPGVIRPANIIPRLPEEKYDEAFHPNPFRQYLDELTVNDQNKSTHPIVTIHENEALMSKKLENTLWGKMGADGNRSSGNLSLNTETNHENNSTTEEEDNISVSSLLITESEEPNANTAKDGPWQGGATSFNPTKVKMEAFETHI